MKKNIVQRVLHTIGHTCILLLCTVFIAACTQEESETLGDTPLIQRYVLNTDAQGKVTAFANFSTEKQKDLGAVKLTKEQRILANGKEMEYNNWDGPRMEGYTYSLSLDKNTEEVTFSLIRNTNKTLKNVLRKNSIEPIALPEELKELQAGKAVMWTGKPQQQDEEIEVFIELIDSPGYYMIVNGSVTDDGKRFVFKEAPHLKGRHKYRLTLRRIRRQPVMQPDGSASGEMAVSYSDTRTVEME